MSVNGIQLCCEYIDGKNLAQFIKSPEYSSISDQNFKKDLILQIMEGVSKGLLMVHSVGLVHNDIKPMNVMIRYDPSAHRLLGVHVIDLGAGVMTKYKNTSSFATIYQYTESYAAPELILEEKYEKKSDVWSLGCLFYYLLTDGSRIWQ